MLPTLWRRVYKTANNNDLNGGRIPGLLFELGSFLVINWKNRQILACYLKLFSFLFVKSNGSYIFQLLEELKVTGLYIFHLFRALQMTGRYFF